MGRLARGPEAELVARYLGQLIRVSQNVDALEYLYLQEEAMEEYVLPAKKHGLNRSKSLATAR